MRSVIVAAAAALIIVPSLAVAQEKPAPKEKEKKICRSVEASTGSRLGRGRVCKTQAEWDAERERASREVERARSISN